ncbi:hypothetical protein JAAARDRAFT_645321 [Jaapia argillacea MUCL 33604]|uniref:Uncharacterized protein n=1 Tax=Jaapia argillacea MUCL 33604 TaxID=933084 RepID=A0A067PVQ9_9AGAM|nr:hypothetical protein JAAARDRAFT_645321 [Jaapia argillacea MUCL 33604]
MISWALSFSTSIHQSLACFVNHSIDLLKILTPETTSKFIMLTRRRTFGRKWDADGVLLKEWTESTGVGYFVSKSRINA